MSLHDQRLQVLQRMERGELSMEDAARLLSRLDAGEPIEMVGLVEAIEVTQTIEDTEAVETIEQPEPLAEIPSPPAAERVEPEWSASPAQDEPKHHRSEWWLLPFVLGLLLTVSAASWMMQGFATAGLGWGFWLSFFPLGLGVAMMWFGWELRKARWLHLRVDQGAGNFPKVIAFSFPLPTGLMRWGMRRFGHFQSVQQAQSVASFMEDLDAAVAKDGPVHILVDGDKDGKRVELWID